DIIRRKVAVSGSDVLAVVPLSNEHAGARRSGKAVVGYEIRECKQTTEGNAIAIKVQLLVNPVWTSSGSESPKFRYWRLATPAGMLGSSEPVDGPEPSQWVLDCSGSVDVANKDVDRIRRLTGRIEDDAAVSERLDQFLSDLVRRCAFFRGSHAGNEGIVVRGFAL